MAEKKQLSEKEIEKKVKDLKIELLKNVTKRKSIKREIARLMTMARMQNLPKGVKNQTKFAPKGVPMKGKENK